MESEAQNSHGSAFSAGVVNGRNQITERERLLLLIGLHGMSVNREGTQGILWGEPWGVSPGGSRRSWACWNSRPGDAPGLNTNTL
jgi:hypothetical protein